MKRAELLFQQNGCRIVSRLPYELILETQEEDSLGGEYWKLLRVIHPIIEGPAGAKRENLLYKFLLRMFKGAPPTTTDQQDSRRLET